MSTTSPSSASCERGLDVFLSVAAHFRPASGSRLEAMRINLANLHRLKEKAA